MTNPTFVLHIRTTVCRSCHKAHTTSELYVVANVRPNYRHLVRATDRPTYQPEVVTLPHDSVAICHECTAALPRDPEPPRDWHVPLGWRQREREAATRPTAQQSSRRDSDDLL